METSSPTYNLLQWFVQWFLMGLYPLSWFLGVIIEIWGVRVGCGHDRCYQDTLFLVCWSDTLQRYIADILQYKNVMLWKPQVTSQQWSVYWNAKQNKRQKKKRNIQFHILGLQLSCAESSQNQQTNITEQNTVLSEEILWVYKVTLLAQWHHEMDININGQDKNHWNYDKYDNQQHSRFI